MAPALVDRLVEAWCARDRTHAFVETDLEVIESTAAARAFAADRLHAFGILGRMVAERGGSPTLAATMVDGARQALDSLDAPSNFPRVSSVDAAWVMPARAALVESFVAARQQSIRTEATMRWEYPRCAVGLHEASVAIAAGYPEDDAEALTAWASRVAHGAALAGVRRAVVSGSRAAQAALAEALEIAGIERLPACAIGRGPGRGDGSS
jgi:hypothetical protein